MNALEWATQKAVMATALVERVVFGHPVMVVRRVSDGRTEPAVREDGDDWMRLSADFKAGPADVFELMADGEVLRVLETKDFSDQDGVINIRWTFDVAPSPVTA